MMEYKGHTLTPEPDIAPDAHRVSGPHIVNRVFVTKQKAFEAITLAIQLSERATRR